jgi:hypothetical protein
MPRTLFCRLGIAFLVATMSLSARAQSVGSIVGTVTDPNGAAISNCQVTVTEAETGLSRIASCGPNGYYVVPSLRPTTYTVTVVAPGFSKLTRQSITLQANQPLTVDLKLSVGAASQRVTVNTAAVQVNTTTATISQVVDSASIVELPLDGRNAATLTTLVAGAVTAPDARATQGLTIPVDVSVAVNGSRGNQTSYWLDGASNTDQLTDINAPFPFPDALQEFSVQTTNYSAQYGQSSGAVVNIVTKSGTNEFHGDAFEFVRNAVFNAVGYFNTSKDQLKRNQFGFTVGGPVILPKYNGRDRTFFFGGYQKTILRDTLGATYNYVPTTANVGGDFSALLDANNPNNPTGQVIQLTDPQNGLPFQGNIIPTNRLDPAFLKLETFLPQSTTNGLVNYPLPDREGYNEWVLRIDQKLSKNDQLTGRYYYDGYTKGTTFIPGNFLSQGDNKHLPDQNFMIQETHVFSPNLLNDFHFSILSINAQETVPSGIPTYTSLGVKVNQDFVGSGNMGMYAYGFMYAGGAWPVTWDRKSYQYGDDLHWVHGKHSLGFGALVMRSSYNDVNGYNVGPQFQFSGDSTGYSLADLSIGAIRQMEQSSGQHLNVVATQMGFYAQDDFHATPRLTLNAGLRYEPFFPWHETHGRVMHFSPAAYDAGTISTQFPNAPPGLSFPGDPGFPANGVNPNYTGFAPRVGFADDLFGNGKTSIRGGIGMFYDTSQVMVADIPFDTNPFEYNLTLISPTGPFSNPYQGISDPFPAPPPGPAAQFPANPAEMTYDPFHIKYQTPVNYSWNVSVDRQLTASWLLHGAYVGSHGSHGLETWELNPAVYIPGSTLPTNDRRLFPALGNITDLVHDVNFSYNGLQISLQRRIRHGFSIMANYTLSRATDDLPESAAVNSGLVPPTIPWNMPNFHRLEYGPSDWDHTNILAVSYLWKIPTIDQSNGLANAVLGGWETTGIISAESGGPFTVYAGRDISQTNLNVDRANVTGDPYGGNACASVPDTACKNWLNPASFSLPATGTFGDATKGEFRGPGFFNFDAGIYKNIPIHNQVQMQFRSEFFNAFNNTEFTNPHTTVTGNAFGAIRATANGPRVIQFALKLSF